MKKLFSIPPTEGVCTHLGFFVGRLGFGLMMAFGHGWGKLPPPQGLIDFIGKLGFPSPLLFAWSAALVEFGGALFLAVGFMTRLSSSLLALTMFVAAFMAHGSDPFAKKEMALLYLTAYIVFALVGPGRYSVDKLVSKR